ncbi:CRISPR-associated protein Cas2 [Rummeliibacillus suwonensis]|uniref:CRISPR-associated protein Cas2 n=1 Tax=Rummeliibacillus suwonensis TaxID=1306154 RepID=UPI00289ACE7A|nr:CRISPR-associated protein Cas2 [Rummeliibacillus suwonensis]
MTVRLITYDLNSPGQDYKKLYEKIKSYGSWAHYLDSVWFVQTTKNISDIRDDLKQVIDKGDHIFICTVNDYSGWTNKKLWEWLKDRI